MTEQTEQTEKQTTRRDFITKLGSVTTGVAALSLLAACDSGQPTSNLPTGTPAAAPQVLKPGDAAYDKQRLIWQGAVDARKPAEIVECTTTQDVVWALNSARQKGLPLAVRSGGHSPAGFSLLDKGLIIDVRKLKKMEVDAGHQLATVGAGITWAEFDAATAKYNLFTPGGSISTVGVAGFIGGGGVGKLLRRHGLGADNLVSAQVVLADGTIRTASEKEDKDLFYAIRGGAGNYGVITEMQFALHPMNPPGVVAGTFIYPIDQAVPVLRIIRDIVGQAGANAPRDFMYLPAFAIAPGKAQGGPFPDNLRNKPVLLVNLSYFGAVDQATKYLQQFAQIGKPAVSNISPIPYPIYQKSVDATAPYGMDWTMRSEWLKSSSDQLIEIFQDAITKSTSPLNQIAMFCGGGALADIAPDATAFSFQRHAAHFIEIIGGAFPNQPSPDAQQQWAHQTWQKVSAGWSAGGGDLNHFGRDEGPDRVRAVFDNATWTRMQQLKKRYDPENIFRSTANIPPASA